MSYNSGFSPEAKLTSLSWGCKADWYIPENVPACEQMVEGEWIGGKIWPRGWFAIVSFYNHDEMRDFGVTERCERVIAGPYPTEEQALEVAQYYFEDIVAELTY